MSQGPLCPNLSQKVQKEVSQMANRNLSSVILLGGLSVNLNHLKMKFKYIKYNTCLQKQLIHYISISHSNQKLSQYFQYITVQRTHTCKLKNT